MRTEAQRLSRASILASVEVGSLRARVQELESEVAGLRRRATSSDNQVGLHPQRQMADQ